MEFVLFVRLLWLSHEKKRVVVVVVKRERERVQKETMNGMKLDCNQLFYQTHLQ